MTRIDDTIRGALDEDDRAFLSSLENDRGLFAQVGDTFGGPLGSWAKLIFVMSLALGGAMIYVFLQLIDAPSGNARLGWGLLLLGLFIAQGFVKEWFFARMNLIATLRELKKLQLQVAQLSEGIEARR